MAVNENKWGVLYCPKHSWRDKNRWAKIRRVLDAHGVDYDYVQSENVDSVERLVKMLINNGYKTIVLVGGDSALNDAVNCLMEAGQETREQVALGIIPNGMMNDFAHFWGMKEGEWDTLVADLQKRRVRKIDLGCLRYTNKKGEHCHRYFANCVNIGLIASIMGLRRRMRHLFGARALSFLFSFILMIFQRMEYRMRVKINTDVIHRKVMTLCVGNALGYGQTPNAVPYNGLLDVSLVYHPKMTQLFEGIYLFWRGKFLNHRSVHPYRTREVIIEEAPYAPVGVDGRLISTPVGRYTIQVEEGVINFLMPD